MAPQDSKIAVEILQSINNRTQSLREIVCYAWLLLTYIVIITILGRLTLDPAGIKYTQCVSDQKISIFAIYAILRNYVFNYNTILAAGCYEAANCRYCFYSQAKNQVFRPAGATRCTDSSQTWQRRRAPGSAWLCEISRESVQTGGNAAPKHQKFPLFGKESPRRGDSLDRFPKFLGAFIRITILR